VWLITKRGFYSAVQKKTDPDVLLSIRARSRKDLENLKDLLPKGTKIVESKGTDYRWRVKIQRKDWIVICARLAAEVDYHNFKDEVKHQPGGAQRASILMSVWSALGRIQWGGKSSYFDDSWPASPRWPALDSNDNCITCGKRMCINPECRDKQDAEKQQQQQLALPAPKPSGRSRGRRRTTPKKAAPKKRAGKGAK
jgi:hypothetical protein